MCFLFWDVVYVTRYKDKSYSRQVGSSKSDEIRGRFVGFAWDVGHALTFLVLTDDTQKVIPRSRVRLANVGENNLKLDVEAGAAPERIYISSKRNEEDPNVKLPTIDISNDPFQTQREPFQSLNTSPSDGLSPGETPSGEHLPTSMVPSDNVPDDIPIHVG